MLKLKINDKYTIVEDLPNGVFKATRHGEEWRNLVGDNLILSMAYKIEELQEELDKWQKEFMF
jgi:hypothetical protein